MKMPKHGALRGLDAFAEKIKTAKKVEPEKRAFEGKFGQMFPFHGGLRAADHTKEDLRKLAEKMVAQHEPDVTPETEPDNEENTGISAGYTYLGQFIDHDITFDPVSSLQKRNDVSALVDYRTPKLDLDNIYGREPDDQPYLYDADGMKFLLGQKINGNPADPSTHDLPRNSPTRGAKRAMIGDPRNDENIIVSQLQGIFLRFHNSIVDFKRSHGETPDFEKIQDLVRWHYQWVVINDFLPTIIDKSVIESILPHLKKGTTIHKDKPKLSWLKVDDSKEVFMPIEFAVAAYRFGHSMIRPIYRLNPARQRMFIFPDLVGFDSMPDNLAIDWRLFFDFGDNPNPKSSMRIQPAYKIDTSLVEPLGKLPQSVVAHIPSLAERNLLRGLSMSLPSGQAVARELGLPVIHDKDLKVGKANEDDFSKNKSITEISSAFKDNAPLWFYILAEAMQSFKNDQTPIRLGPVGGRIVGEVSVWLMLSDNKSVFYAKDKNEKGKEVDWEPIEAFTKGGNFGITELITQAQKA
jgi:hypothetical protein